RLPLASLPPGDYVIVDPIDEGEKVKAEICVILYKDHIRMTCHPPFPDALSHHWYRRAPPESPAESCSEVVALASSACVWNEATILLPLSVIVVRTFSLGIPQREG
uniref:Uncharacterized protein n=1 Tax=Gadus morhua TaxID=8049 RepID=A0A8C5D4M0_GADMO